MYIKSIITILILNFTLTTVVLGQGSEQIQDSRVRSKKENLGNFVFNPQKEAVSISLVGDASSKKVVSDGGTLPVNGSIGLQYKKTGMFGLFREISIMGMLVFANSAPKITADVDSNNLVSNSRTFGSNILIPFVNGASGQSGLFSVRYYWISKSQYGIYAPSDSLDESTYTKLMKHKSSFFNDFGIIFNGIVANKIWEWNNKNINTGVLSLSLGFSYRLKPEFVLFKNLAKNTFSNDVYLSFDAGLSYRQLIGDMSRSRPQDVEFRHKVLLGDAYTKEYENKDKLTQWFGFEGGMTLNIYHLNMSAGLTYFPALASKYKVPGLSDFQFNIGVGITGFAPLDLKKK